MTGSKRMGLVVQERDRQLLSELAVMRIIDREMTKLVPALIQPAGPTRGCCNSPGPAFCAASLSAASPTAARPFTPSRLKAVSS